MVTHAYDHDPRAKSFGLEAAQALGLDPARVFKTLMIEVDGRLAVAIVPVTSSLDLKKAAAALGGKKAVMADAAAAQRATGYVLGGDQSVRSEASSSHRGRRIGLRAFHRLRVRRATRARHRGEPD